MWEVCLFFLEASDAPELGPCAFLKQPPEKHPGVMAAARREACGTPRTAQGVPRGPRRPSWQEGDRFYLQLSLGTGPGGSTLPPAQVRAAACRSSLSLEPGDREARLRGATVALGWAAVQSTTGPARGPSASGLRVPPGPPCRH